MGIAVEFQHRFQHRTSVCSGWTGTNKNVSTLGIELNEFTSWFELAETLEGPLLLEVLGGHSGCPRASLGNSDFLVADQTSERSLSFSSCHLNSPFHLPFSSFSVIFPFHRNDVDIVSD